MKVVLNLVTPGLSNASVRMEDTDDTYLDATHLVQCFSGCVSSLWCLGEIKLFRALASGDGFAQHKLRKVGRHEHDLRGVDHKPKIILRPKLRTNLGFSWFRPKIMPDWIVVSHDIDQVRKILRDRFDMTIEERQNGMRQNEHLQELPLLAT